MDVSRTDSSVKNCIKLPISNPKSDPHNIGEKQVLSSGNENTDMLRADLCQKLTKFIH